VLEWRLDPTSPHRLAEVAGPGQPAVVVCDEGYASSLAAATLRELGLRGPPTSTAATRPGCARGPAPGCATSAEAGGPGHPAAGSSSGARKTLSLRSPSGTSVLAAITSASVCR
jgi:hypothetical protein